MVESDCREDAKVPLEVLEQRMCAGAAELAAHEAEWLGWIAEYDVRGGYESWGCTSTAHWLTWRCGLGVNAARERVRVARALRSLPRIDSAYRKGQLTWSKVRALTRVANEHNEADLTDVAISATGAQLERICRAMRTVGGFETEDPAMAFASRAWTKRPNHDGTTTYLLRVVDAETSTIDKQLERIVDDTISDVIGGAAGSAGGDAAGSAGGGAAPRRRQVIDDRNGIAAMRADAAVALLQGTVEAASIPTDVTIVVDADHRCERVDPTVASSGAATTNSDQSVSAETPRSKNPAETRVDADHTCERVDAATASSGAATTRSGANVSAETPRSTNPAETRVDANRGQKVSAETPRQPQRAAFDAVVDGTWVPELVARRLCCEPRVRVLAESARTATIGVGRSERFVPQRVRRALGRRDGECCQFPGCSANKRLHAHHIVHWVDGGPTDLDNLILLCHFHHHLVHEGGWTIDPATHAFITPDAAVADPRPAIAKSTLERLTGDLVWTETDPAPPRVPCDRLDLHYAVSVIADNEDLHRRRQLATCAAFSRQP